MRACTAVRSGLLTLYSRDPHHTPTRARRMMKLKSNQTRTYDGDGYKKRAACLCFRSESEEEVRRRAGGVTGVGGHLGPRRGGTADGGLCAWAPGRSARPGPSEVPTEIPEAKKRGKAKGWWVEGKRV